MPVTYGSFLAAISLTGLLLQASTDPAAAQSVPGGADPVAVTRPIHIDTGTVRGVQEAGALSFRGIPYAAPPVGNLRWEPPRAPAAWTGVRDATRFGSACPQAAHQGSAEASYDEDCLTINVTVPSQGTATGHARRPVIVWIHGGAFVGGSSALDPLTQMAVRGNVIMASFNYRLGVFGFMAAPMFGRDYDGAYGLKDQRAALHWVQRNIAAFGGDPANVTIAGESAGAASVCMHLAAPGEAKGLFSRAIIRNAGCAQHFRTVEDADSVGQALAILVGCDQGDTALACLRAKPARDLLEAGAKIADGDAATFAPAVGTLAVPGQPRDALAEGRFVRVPIINGADRDESRPYAADGSQSGRPVTDDNYAARLQSVYGGKAFRVLVEYPASAYPSAAAAFGTARSDYTPAIGFNHCSTLETAELASAFVPVFQYEFASQDPLPDVQDAGEAGARRSAGQPLTAVMMQYWTGFASTGQPRAENAPPWGRFESKTRVMRFEPGKVGFVDAGTEHHCDFWSRLYPDRLGPRGGNRSSEQKRVD